MNDDPISIILITSGSRGLKLLFRYPFTNSTVVRKKPHRKVSIALEDGFVKNPYSLVKNEVTEYICERHLSRKGELCGFEDSVLATMLVPKPTLCEQNFELKIEEVKLVGYPVLVTDHDDHNNFKDCHVSKGTTAADDIMIKMVHIVFVLNSDTEPRCTGHYQRVSKMLGKALRHEERRCRYLTAQREIMVKQGNLEEKENNHEAILEKSELAQDLVKIFHSMCETGIFRISLNNWLNLSYCFPHKIHRLDGRKTFIDAQEFNKYIGRIKPYHTLLLTNESDREQENLLHLLPHDASPVLNRLINLSNHIKNFQTLCQDADISLPQIFQIVAHLVYWGKCTVIYPLAESNVYVLSESAPTEIDSKYAEEFVDTFPKQSLHNYLARFSIPTTLGEFRDPLSNDSQQKKQVQIVTWLLKRHLLKQLHTYVWIMPEVSPTNDDVELHLSLDKCSLSKSEKRIFDSFSPVEKRSLVLMQSKVDKDDILFFLSMSKYFRGEHHLEDIMYYENLPRSKLLILIDKFRSMLITVQHEDPAISMMG